MEVMKYENQFIVMKMAFHADVSVRNHCHVVYINVRKFVMTVNVLFVFNDVLKYDRIVCINVAYLVIRFHRKSQSLPNSLHT